MIQVWSRSFPQNSLSNLGSIEKMIVQQMLNDHALYSYPSRNEFLFEVKLRTNIIESAKEMNKSEAAFTTFRYARCNSTYWYLTNSGGFLLKPNISPSDAILDILKNSSLYAFECATACVIIFYHAVLKIIGKSLFNSFFQNLYLYSWHSDPDLGVYTFHSNQYILGDVVYFNNPDYNPETPWYRGVNAVAISDGKFFGHGFGIRTATQMVEVLNELRKPGSNQTAYLTSLVTRPSFNHLATYPSSSQRGFTFIKTPNIVVHHNQSSISFLDYLLFLNKKI